MAGVVFGLTMRREIWLRHQVPTSRIPASLAKITNRNSITAKEPIRPSGSLASPTWTSCAPRAGSARRREGPMPKIRFPSRTNADLFRDVLDSAGVDHSGDDDVVEHEDDGADLRAEAGNLGGWDVAADREHDRRQRLPRHFRRLDPLEPAARNPRRPAGRAEADRPDLSRRP